MKKLIVLLFVNILFVSSLFAVPLGTPKYITIHHSGAVIDQNKTDYTKTVQSIRDYHINHNKWADIGYHYLVDPNGKIHNGRPITEKGAHCKVLNKGNIGVCLLGNFNEQKPTIKQVNALLKLVKQLRKQYKTIEQIKKHKDFMGTECPGKNINLKSLGIE
jgi:N-acetyl-anhydromuramyl-L-alanine amidase AmpD